MNAQEGIIVDCAPPRRRGRFEKSLRRYWMLYLMLLPAVVIVCIYCYLPMVGLVIAFQNYLPSAGISGFFNSKWVGFANFSFLKQPYFWQCVKNTLVIAVYRTVVCLVLPIILAIMINELKSRKFQRITQTIGYMPYFMSWVIIAYLVQELLNPDTGTVNTVIQWLGGQPASFLALPSWFPTIMVVEAIWQSIGWSTIIYFAALSNINPELQEACLMDGAKRYQRIWHVDLPSIRPTIVIVFILNMPSLLNANYAQVWPLHNNANAPTSMIVEAFIIQQGLGKGQFSQSTAMGLVFSVVTLAVVLIANYISRKAGDEGLF